MKKIKLSQIYRKRTLEDERVLEEQMESIRSDNLNKEKKSREFPSFTCNLNNHFVHTVLTKPHFKSKFSKGIIICFDAATLYTYPQRTAFFMAVWFLLIIFSPDQGHRLVVQMVNVHVFVLVCDLLGRRGWYNI